jgi:hypothetical protein
MKEPSIDFGFQTAQNEVQLRNEISFLDDLNKDISLTLHLLNMGLIHDQILSVFRKERRELHVCLSADFDLLMSQEKGDRTAERPWRIMPVALDFQDFA